MEKKGKEMPFLHGQGAQQVPARLQWGCRMFPLGWISPLPAQLENSWSPKAPSWPSGISAEAPCEPNFAPVSSLLTPRGAGKQHRNDSLAASSGKGI